ncbi:MAG: ammonia monooxygenase [Caulobacteraceae bacterium]|nr:ammonia monooxygenase [Caulobacteraceae bacterium]
MARAKKAKDGYGRAYVRVDCPGCDGPHMLPVHGESRPNWAFNGYYERPTLSPSILVTYNGKDADTPEGCPSVCHSFVTDGRIQFLDDCTHALRGQTVDLPEIEEHSDEA